MNVCPGLICTPDVIIEGRAPLAGQVEYRQTYLAEKLAAQGLAIGLIDADDPNIYTSDGQICRHRQPGIAWELPGELPTDSYAWRVRGLTWEDGDPSAFPAASGFNSEQARTELATRDGLASALGAMGLGAVGTPLVDPEREPVGDDEFVFVKPRRVSDVSEDPGCRACLTTGRQLSDTLASVNWADGAVVQRVEPFLPARDLRNQLGLPDEQSPVDYLHALRVFSLADETPAVELRLTDPKKDIGRRFASSLHLLEPELVFDRLPAVAALHATVRQAFAERYGLNYLAFDYLVTTTGDARLLNALPRALTPNLKNQPSSVQRLALATADVEVAQLVALARKRQS